MQGMQESMKSQKTLKLKMEEKERNEITLLKLEKELADAQAKDRWLNQVCFPQSSHFSSRLLHHTNSALRERPSMQLPVLRRSLAPLPRALRAPAPA
jgi:hypothetical protein